MQSPTRGSPSADWVDIQRGLVSRDIFVSDDVCQLEMERIFDRTWVFLAHETEIPKPGDFVSRSMGRAPVVVVRDDDGGGKRRTKQLPASRRSSLSRRLR